MISGSLMPIWVIDFISGILLLVLAVYLLHEVKKIRRMRPGVPIWMYLHWQVMALSIFAFSHATGHILLRVFTFMGRGDAFKDIAPLTGGVNSLTFVIVGILFFLYKDIEGASVRFGTLNEARRELEVSLRKLQETSVQREKDAQEIFVKNRELTTLNRIAIAVGKSLDLDKVLSGIIGEVKNLFEVDFLGIYLIEDKRLALKMSEGLSDSFKQKAATRKPEEPWFSRAVGSREPFFAQERTGEKAGRIDPEIKAEGVQAWAAVPLVSKGEVTGALTVGSSRYDGIDTRKLDTLVTIGGYAGVVIENSVLYEQLKQKVADMERFSRLSVGREMRIIELKERIRSLMENK